MADELKDLLAKIQEEGVKAADEKAARIVAEAAKKAAESAHAAEREAARIIEEARARIAAMEEGGRSSLRQASRDMLLALRKEIGALLDRVIAAHVHKALTTDEIAKMILGLVKGCGGEHKDRIIITLRKDEAEHIGRALLAELGAEARKGITIKPSGDMRGGFLISFDSGRSCYDFTDTAVADYIAAFMKPQLGALLQEAVAGKR